jgi:gluconolactonase
MKTSQYLSFLCSLVASWHATAAPRAVLADAVVDLRTSAGAALVGAEWRYHDATIAAVDHRAPGADLKPSGAAIRTHDIAPKAGAAHFDDSGWDRLSPDTLEARRSTGRLAFAWYRLSFTVPEKLSAFATRGTTAVLELVVDDYAEIWVNGNLSPVLGSSGGAFPSGWNSVQRVVLGRDVQPGQRFQVAIFAANGPLSDPPPNYIWLRSATLDFYRAERARLDEDAKLDVARFEPAIDAIVPYDAKLEKLADGFAFTEGPVWLLANAPDHGSLLFSDPNNNRIYRWSSHDGDVSVYRTKSGYGGANIGEYRQPGSNGLTLDSQGRLTIAEHGNRRITRLEKNGTLTVLADRFEGKRLNSPNDLVYRSDGTLFFTDPFFGLPKFGDDPRRELSFTGVFALRDGKLTLVTRELTGPNGLAFSPDEQLLYVGNWDDHRKVVMRYTLNADGSAARSEVFADLTKEPGDDAIDGIKADQRGNVYVSGPGGVWIFSPSGQRLGLLRGPEHPHNLAWGDADFRTLYLTAQTGLYRVRLNVAGSGAALHPES